ncbi:PLC family EF-hand domain-containing protein [Nocardiopsis nanhaiensis]
MWRFGWNPRRVLRGTDLEAELLSASFGTDPLARAGCEAVREGDLGAGANLLAEAGEDPEVRAYLAEALGRAAAERPDDVAGLVEEGADRADTLLWLGHALLARAKSLPSGGTEGAQADRKAFEAALHETRVPLEEAARLNPEDAVPWAALQTVAMGLGDREERDRTWSEATARAPRLFPAHMTRVRSLAPSRGGSAEEMFAAAGAAADTAPEGSPLPAVLALAHAEHLRGEQSRLVREGNSPYMAALSLGRLHGDAVRELFELAQRWAASAVPHVRDVQAHHLLGWAFYRSGEKDLARWHLGLVGRYVCDVPWSFFGSARVEAALAMAELGVDPRESPGAGDRVTDGS